MACFTVEDLSFRYAGTRHQALCDLSFSVEEGAFVTVCSLSGSSVGVSCTMGVPFRRCRSKNRPLRLALYSNRLNISLSPTRCGTNWHSVWKVSDSLLR